MNIRSHFIAFLLFVLAACYITYPLIFHLGEYTTGFADELLISWIQNWVLYSLFANPFSLFDANIFYPYHNTLAYSDIFITSSLLALIPLKLIGEPIVTINFTLLTSLVFLGFSVYLLARYLTKDFWASLLVGILVVFSPVVVDKTTHVQILGIHWVALSILTFLVFLHKNNSKYLLISLLLFILQIYNSFLPGYFILFSFSIILFFYWLNKKKNIKKVFVKKNLIFSLIAFFFTLPLVIPYYQVAQEFSYKRDIRDAIHLALQPEDFLFTSRFSHLEPYLNALPIHNKSQNNEFQAGHIGFVFASLFLIGIVYTIKNCQRITYLLKAFFAISFTGLILSLGPILHLGRHTIHEPFPIPLPYALFYYVIPGFQGFRNSARWEMFFILGAAIVIALILPSLLKRFSRNVKICIYLLLMIGAIVEFNFPMKFVELTQVKDFPKVYSWIATTPKNSVVIEMPVYNWNMFPYGPKEYRRMYYSTSHFRKLVNGGSGFTPPPWEKFAYQIDEFFPSENSLQRLQSLGVTYIIVHKKEFDVMHQDGFTINKKIIADGKTILEELRKNKSVRLVKIIDDDYIFELTAEKSSN